MWAKIGVYSVLLVLLFEVCTAQVNGVYSTPTCSCDLPTDCSTFTQSSYNLVQTSSNITFGGTGLNVKGNVDGAAGGVTNMTFYGDYTGMGTYQSSSRLLQLTLVNINTTRSCSLSYVQDLPVCNELSCSACTAHPSCGWCIDGGGSCMAGSFAGPTSPNTCTSTGNAWVWDTCSGCLSYSTCVDCVLDFTNCVWCSNSSTCVPGSPLGPTVVGQCDAWQYGQCYVTGLLAIILGCTAAGVVVIVIIIICCCCCCCRRRRNALLDEEGRPASEKAGKKGEKHSETDGTLSALQARRREMELKYNLKPRV